MFLDLNVTVDLVGIYSGNRILILMSGIFSENIKAK